MDFIKKENIYIYMINPQYLHFKKIPTYSGIPNFSFACISSWNTSILINFF